MPYLIVPAVPEDATAIGILVNSAYRGESSKKGWTTEAGLLDGTRTDAKAIEALINRADTTVLKYVEDNIILGCVELQKKGDGLYLGMLTVQPDLQGKGIGKALLNAAEAEGRRLHCSKIFMTVISVRDELIAWYLRHGYRSTGEHKPFDFNDPVFGVPKQKLEFVVLEKVL